MHSFKKETLANKRLRLNPGGEFNNNGKGRRIPCPLDGNHTIWESNLLAHLKKCNKAKQKIKDEKQIYYQHGINLGGCGSIQSDRSSSRRGDNDDNDNDEISMDISKDERYYQNFAIRILKAYEQTFPAASSSSLSEMSESTNCSKQRSTSDIINMTREDLYCRLPYKNHFPTRE